MSRCNSRFVASVLIVIGLHASSTLADSPTFSRDVAKIVHEKCTICHRPDSTGPFSLITHSDVKRRAETILAVLEDDFMPPWKPIDHGIAFANDRSLSAEEKRTIKRWIEAGCPEGDLRQAPPLPKFSAGWTLGKPDMVVRMNGQFEVPADGPDIYRSFVFPLDLPTDKWVKAVELRPRAKTSVHHAIFFLDLNGNARKLDGTDGKAGIEGMGFLGGFGAQEAWNSNAPSRRSGLPRPLRRALGQTQEEDRAYHTNREINRALGGYVPGATPNLLPGDLAMELPLGSDVVMQTHFHPSGRAETEQAELALYFAPGPPSRKLVPIMVPPMFGFGSMIKVPAGEKEYRVTDTIELPIETQAIGVSAHAHYICREVKMTARLPNGESIVLLEIDDWDLDWQDQYLFAEPIDLPAHTVLKTDIIYDNSIDNPENPFHPPQEIRWGRGSNDEMGSVTLLTIAKKNGESSKLRDANRQNFLEKLVNRDSAELLAMLMQLDNDHNGQLERSEAPPRLNATVFRLIDTDRNDALDSTELSRALSMRERMRNLRNKIKLKP